MKLNFIPAIRNMFLQNPTTGVVANIGPDGGLDVSLQDQHTQSFDIYFSQIVGVQSTLTADAVINEFDIDVSPAHGIVAGDQLVMYDSVSSRLYIGNVLVVTVDNIELDTPINFSYPTTTTTIVRSTKDLNVDGSTTRQTFAIAPPVDRKIDITRIIFQMTTNGATAFENFGDIAGGLLRGIVLRSVNGKTTNYFNVKTNGDFSNLMYDVANFSPSNPSGVYGISGRMTWGGNSKHGVVIRLEKDESLELIVQDDLTDILTFRMIACGHIVDED